jgi:hypothetical protein
MLKTFYKLLLCIGIGMAVQQVDASTSKVRLAANFGVQAIKATASAAKAHPFLSLAAAATTTAVVAAQREHSKYRRVADTLTRNAEEAKRLNAAIIEKATKIVELENSGQHKKADILRKEIKEMGDRLAKIGAENRAEPAERARRIADAADQVTFRQHLNRLYTYYNNNYWERRDIVKIGALLAYKDIVCCLGALIVPYMMKRNFERSQAAGVPCLIGFNHIKTLEEALKLGKDRRATFLKIGPGSTLAIATVVAGKTVYNWLAARRAAAEQAAQA